jgi:uncharacterized damage-inducible protein DinB
MDEMAKAFSLGLERANTFVGYFDNGLEGDDWYLRPEGAPNPPIWILGHMAFYRAQFLELLTGERVVPEGWRELLAMGSEPLTDPRGYPAVGECRKVLDESLVRLRTYLETVTAAELESPPAAESRFFKTKGEVLVHLTHHEAHHTGSLNLLRRMLGKEKAI